MRNLRPLARRSHALASLALLAGCAGIATDITIEPPELPEAPPHPSACAYLADVLDVRVFLDGVIDPTIHSSRGASFHELSPEALGRLVGRKQGGRGYLFENVRLRPPQVVTDIVAALVDTSIAAAGASCPEPSPNAYALTVEIHRFWAWVSHRDTMSYGVTTEVEIEVAVDTPFGRERFRIGQLHTAHSSLYPTQSDWEAAYAIVLDALARDCAAELAALLSGSD